MARRASKVPYAFDLPVVLADRLVELDPNPLARSEARLAQTKANLYDVAKPRVSVKDGGLGADIIISERKEDGH